MRTAAVLLLAGLLVSGCTTGGRASLDAYAQPAPDRLVVSGLHGACDTVQRARVDETDQEVRVTVPLRLERGGCDDIGLPLLAEVRLDAPLGDRRVVDPGGRTLDRRCTVDRQPTSPFLGLTVAEVEALLPADGYAEVRVVCRDGQTLDRTSDLRPERLDVAVEDGRVLSVED